LKATTCKPVLIGLAAAILAIFLFSSLYPNVKAQDSTFTTADQFNIRELNGSIRFAQNGSYSSATLENGTWIFDNLRLNNSQPLGNLKVSAENSNLTLWSFRSNLILSRNAFLRYNAQGTGSQTIDLGLNSTQPSHPIEWTVVVPGAPGSQPSSVFLAEGDKWNLLPDNSVVVSGLTGNVSLTHFGFNIPIESNLPFYQQHSILIITATLLAATAAVALVIRFKVRS
jgi:hypothetical protein